MLRVKPNNNINALSSAQEIHMRQNKTPKKKKKRKKEGKFCKQFVETSSAVANEFSWFGRLTMSVVAAVYTIPNCTLHEKLCLVQTFSVFAFLLKISLDGNNNVLNDLGTTLPLQNSVRSRWLFNQCTRYDNIRPIQIHAE